MELQQRVTSIPCALLYDRGGTANQTARFGPQRLHHCSRPFRFQKEQEPIFSASISVIILYDIALPIRLRCKAFKNLSSEAQPDCWRDNKSLRTCKANLRNSVRKHTGDSTNVLQAGP